MTNVQFLYKFVNQYFLYSLTDYNLLLNMNLQTKIELKKSKFGINYSDNILMIGSCFTDNIGAKLEEAQFNVLKNPFGTNYNPISICYSIDRINNCEAFTPDELVQMGSGLNRYCSFFHHTLDSSESLETFLKNANMGLCKANEFWDRCNKIIITLGTSKCYLHKERNIIVSNCLKRDAKEFEIINLEIDTIVESFKSIILKHPQKKFIFTVSPIRHKKDGFHINQLNKARLLLAVDALAKEYPDQVEYFPAYEIMMDELRDYRFYADDMIHPSNLAIQYIFDLFVDWAVNEKEKEILKQKIKESRQKSHISLF